jgi:general secretion pathway protein A
MDDPMAPTPPPPDGGARAFQPTADPTFLWLGPQHGAALTMLRAAVIGDGGLLVLAGPPGTGKTVLTQALAADVNEAPIAVGWLAYPNFEGLDFLRAIALAFGLPARFDAPEGFHRLFERFLGDARAGGRRPLLIIDEAQALPESVLQTMRSLPVGPDPAGERPSLSVLLAGHADLLDRLRLANLEADVTCRLHPLTREQTEAYIAHRLRVAGITNNRFSPEAIRTIWGLAEGVPRVINALCYCALGMQRQESRALVTSPTVLAAARELELGAPAPARVAETAELQVPNAWPPPRRGRRAATAAAIIAALALTAVALQARSAPDSGQGSPPPAAVPSAPAALDSPASSPPGPGAAAVPDAEPAAMTSRPAAEPALLPRAAAAASSGSAATGAEPSIVPAVAGGLPAPAAVRPSAPTVPQAAAVARAAAPGAAVARAGNGEPAVSRAPRPGDAGADPDPGRVIDWLLDRKDGR